MQMQSNFLTTVRSLKLLDAVGGCKATPITCTPAVDTVCPCRRPPPPGTPPAARFRRNNTSLSDVDREDGDEGHDLWFVVGEEEVACDRARIAALSKPLNTLLYGGFAEARRDRIDFTRNGVSPRGMRAVAAYSRQGRIDDFPPDTVIELLAFSNKFCCLRQQARLHGARRRPRPRRGRCWFASPTRRSC